MDVYANYNYGQDDVINSPQPETLQPALSGGTDQSKAVHYNAGHNTQIRDRVISGRQSHTVKNAIDRQQIKLPVLFSGPRGPIQNVVDNPQIHHRGLFSTQGIALKKSLAPLTHHPPGGPQNLPRYIFCRLSIYEFLILNTDSKVDHMKSITVPIQLFLQHLQRDHNDTCIMECEKQILLIIVLELGCI